MIREQDDQQERAEHRAAELTQPIDEGEGGIDPPRDEEAEGDRRIEVPARDVTDRGRHHGDDEPVRKRDRHQIASAGD